MNVYYVFCLNWTTICFPLPQQFSLYCYLNSDIQCYFTRSHHDYHMYSITTNIRKFNIRYHEPNVYNEITLYIQSAEPVCRFKTIEMFSIELLLNVVTDHSFCYSFNCLDIYLLTGHPFCMPVCLLIWIFNLCYIDWLSYQY